MESGPVSRRGFLLGSLGSSLVVTIWGTTGLLLRTSPSHAAEAFVADVTGAYSFKDATTGCRVRVTLSNGIRRIRANGLPNHSTGQFPNAGNPKSVLPQDYDFSLPLNPTREGGSVAYSIPQPFGIAVNGVLFDPLAAEWYENNPNSGWSDNALSNLVDLGLDDNESTFNPQAPTLTTEFRAGSSTRCRERGILR